MKIAMHVITKHKQQLGKRLFFFAASCLYNYHAALQSRCHISSHATSKMPPICKSDVLLSLFHDALMLWHLLHWHWHVLTEHKTVTERGAPGSWWEPYVPGGGGGNLIGAPQSLWYWKLLSQGHHLAKTDKILGPNGIHYRGVPL